MSITRAGARPPSAAWASSGGARRCRSTASRTRSRLSTRGWTSAGTIEHDPPPSRRAEDGGVGRLPVAAPGAPLPVRDERLDGQSRELVDQHSRGLDPPSPAGQPCAHAAPPRVWDRLADVPPAAAWALRLLL